MICDNSTNVLYLADTLPEKYPTFYERFEKVLRECKIDFELLPDTKDVWAVDYMPVQVSRNHFVQFIYAPDYLQTPKYLKTISDVDRICKAIGITPVKSNIVLDGGNVTKCADKVIMTDKVFRENPAMEQKQLIKELRNFREVDKLFFIPEDPNDFTGHSDGMVRFVDENTVLINNYSKEEPEFKTAFYNSLKNTGLQLIEIPYAPDLNDPDSAKGLYLNYLQMKNVVIIPTFGIKEDDIAVRQLEQIFYGSTIKTIDCNELATDGGILHCISWNIKGMC